MTPPLRTSTVQRFDRLRELQSKIGCDWQAITACITTTEGELAELEKILVPGGRRPLTENVSLVFFGSLARGESTSLSDLDWTLLVNGEVDVRHFPIVRKIQKDLRDAKKRTPSTFGSFGGLSFSHEIVHCIGGSDDTNKNLTLRMLLLLESISIGDDEPRRMVVRAVLQRYLMDDTNWTGKLPHFLLNDIVRYWRTMTVDFADKVHDQENERWALRNAKLRFSRKLIFLTGMLACFSWHLRGLKSIESESGADGAVRYFEDYLSRPPLEILADELLRAEAPKELCIKIFSAYNHFLMILNDERSRNELAQIPRDRADKSSTFQQIRELGHEFRDGLLDWLYMPDTRLAKLVKLYALF